MRLPIRSVLIAALSSLALPASAQQPIAYPAKGQSAQQQQNDTGQCQAWAKQTTGVDPMALAQAGAGASAPPQPGGERVRGAVGGALVGGVVGGIGGRGGEGAAAGAVVGTMAGGARQREKQRARSQQQQAQQQQVQSQLSTFNRAYAACMSGRGYTIQ